VTRVAVVDLGTNSTRLLVADIRDRQVQEVHRRIAITGLGEGVDANRALAPAAIARVAERLAEYRQEIDDLGAERQLAYATSAVRDAGNSAEFLAGVTSKFGLPTRLLSGDEEARLTFLGATTVRELDSLTLVVDLGGGSTELVLGDGGGVTFATSLAIGCLRLTERFAHCDPPAARELEEMALSVRSLLHRTVPTMAMPTSGIAVAGTATTLATLHLGLPAEDLYVVHGHVVPTAWIAAEAVRLAATPVAELAVRPGIEPRRAPVIAAGSLALAEILLFFELEAVEVSEWDILHGAALEAAAE
jgi:exopolyphosphatase/guanosine-5'-triphosphate,3'-diphosphate pyrophosphatase